MKKKQSLKKGRQTNGFRLWLKEPLVHFLAAGLLLFAGFHYWGGGTGEKRIVITPGQIEAMAARFARTWQRPPTDGELKGLIDDHVREEIASREAMAMGLDRDDTIIRRRLRQKFEFIVEGVVDATPVTEAELQAWLDRYPERYRNEPEIAFRQVYLSPDRRGGAVLQDARRLLAELSTAGPDVDPAALGDPLMLPNEVPRTTRSDIARQFGEDFAAALMDTAPGRWSGPIRSGFGVHLVWVSERIEASTPVLAQVRPLVERDLRAERRQRHMDRMYADLASRYSVTVEQPNDESARARMSTGLARGAAR